VVYVGPSASNATKVAKILVKGDSGWNPDSPSAKIDGATVLDAVGSSDQACFVIKAYNGVGVSSASESTCVTLPK
jgi:hypothetical protein